MNLNSHIRRFLCHGHVIIVLLFLFISINTASSKKTINKIDFSNKEFDSVTNFSNAHFDTWADFSNAYFGPWANFSDAHFNSPAIFTGVHFDSVADFSYGHFSSWTYFYDAYFKSRANFSHVYFDSLAYFSHTHFCLSADFFKTQFDSWSDFSNAHFDIWADFSNAHFYSLAYFYDARFDIWADFSDAHFDTLANFRYAHFDSFADFSNVHFASLADFEYAHFKNKIVLRNLTVTQKVRFDFNNSVLPDTIDLANNPDISLDMSSTIDFTLADSLDNKYKTVKINSLDRLKHYIETYFYPSESLHDLKGKHWINLYNTDISRIKIDYSHFRLYFKDIEDTLRKELSNDIKESIYEQLLKNFKDRGQMDSYEKLDIEYQWFKGRDNPIITGIIDWWWRFGYEKWRIFIHSIIIIILFSSVNFFLMNRLNDKNNGVYHIDLVPEFLVFKYSENTPYRLLRRLWFSIVYTSIIFFLLTFKIEKIRYSKPISLWVMFIYTIGLICMGFIANLLLQK